MFKRCTRCNARVPERRCPKCGARDSFTWGFVVDMTPKDEQGRLLGQQKAVQGFTSKGAAQAALNQLQVEKATGAFIDPSRVTLGEYLTTWIAAGCGGVRPATLRGLEVNVRVHIRPRIGHIPLQQLNRSEIQAMYRDLAVSGYANGPTAEQMERYAYVARRWNAAAGRGAPPSVAALAREVQRSEATVRFWVRRCHELGLLGGRPAPVKKGRGLSPKSIWNIHICLRAALYDAMEVDPPILKKNGSVGAMKEPDTEQEMATFTREELDDFLEFMRGDRDFALWWTIAYSGMRRGEALGLRWSDVK